MRNEEGSKFTDTYYATRDEIERTYNTTNVTDILRRVKDYRSYYDYETPLRTYSDSFYSLCLTRSLLAKAYALERKLVLDERLFFSLKQADQSLLTKDYKLSALIATSRNSGLKPHEATLRKIVDNSLSAIPQDLFIIDAYSAAFDKFQEVEEISLSTIYSINKTLILDDETAPVKLRTSLIENLNNPLKQAEPDKVPHLLQSLLDTLKDEEIPLLLRALIIIYFFTACRPFEFSNEETSAILAKSFLASNGVRLAYLLDFESLAFSKSDLVFKRLVACQDNDDLTYACFSFLPYLINQEEALHNKLLSIKNNPTTTEETIKQDGNVTGERALPIFPLSIDQEEAKETADKLMKIYPALKRKQAHFYSTHCTIGLYYTVNDFKEYEKTVYETARTSMDDLANKGFYKKSKLNNKFIYSPIPIKEV